jgi:Secretion system C-terminal sorting domain
MCLCVEKNNLFTFKSLLKFIKMKTFFNALISIAFICLAHNPLKAQDRALEEILLPDSLFFCKVQTFSVKVVIRGNIYDTFRIGYQIGNQPRVEELVPKSTNLNFDSIQYTFKTLAIAPANLNDTLRVTLLTQDQSSANNERFIVIRNGATQTIPFKEDFEQPRFPPLDWSATPIGFYDAGWQNLRDIIGRDGVRNSVAYFYEGYKERSYERNYGYFMLPAIDLKKQKNPFLVFDLALINERTLTFGVEVSTDCGGSFKKIYSKDGIYGYYSNIPIEQNVWVKDSVNLIPYIDSTILIRFYATHGNAEFDVKGIFLDNIQIYDAPIPVKDVAISRIISPQFGSNCASKSQLPIEIELKNMGAAVLDTFIMSYQMIGTPSVFDTILRSLAFNQTLIHKFSKPFEIPQNGVIDLSFSVKVNGDVDERNDAKRFNDLAYPRYDLPYAENFEATPFLPKNFPNNATNYSWFYSDIFVIGSDGNSTKAPSSLAVQGINRTQLIPPFLDLRNQKKPFLTFDMAYPKLDANIMASRNAKQDSLRIQISTDCGRSYRTVYEKRGDTLTSSKMIGTSYQMQWYPNSAADWRRDTVNLSQYKDSIIIIRFVSLMGGYASTYIDNLKVETGFDYDLGIVEKQKPTSALICASDKNALPVRLVVRNNGFLPTDSIQLSYQLDTEGVVSETLVRRINPRDTIQYQFRKLLNIETTGKHDLILIIRYLNDENTKNDTLKTTLLIGNEYRPNLIEDFELAAFPPLDWQLRLTKAKGWDRSLTIGSVNNQYTIAAIAGAYYDEKGAIESLISPPINLSNTEKPVVIFDRFSPNISGDFYKDSLVIDISTDCGMTFQRTDYVRTGAALSTIQEQRFEPRLSSDWKTDTLDLTAFKGKQVLLRFSRIFQTGGNIYLDNIRFFDVVSKNISLISILNPVDTTPLCPNNPFILALKIRNDGTQPIDSFNVKYRIDNQPEITERLVLSIQPKSIKTFQVPFLLRGLSAGQHKLRVILNLTGDTDNALDTLSQDITVQSTLKTPFFENFDAVQNFPPNGWIIQSSGSNTWKKLTVINKNGEATPAAYFGNINNKGLKDQLVIAPIDLKNALKPKLVFDVACARFSNASNDTLSIEISTDCGLNYRKIYLKSGSTLATATNWGSSEPWMPTAFLWRTDSVDLSAFTDSLVLLRFVNIGNNGHHLYLDDVRIADSSTIVKTQDPIVAKSFSKVYPNPTACDLIIEIDKLKTKAIKLNLLNAQGQIVKHEYRELWDTPQYQWALCDLPSGFYMLNVYNGNQMEQHKIVLLK